MPLLIADRREEKIKNNIKHILEIYSEKINDKCKEILAVEKPFVKIDENYVINGKVDLIYKDCQGRINLVDFKARTLKGIENTNVEELKYVELSE